MRAYDHKYTAVLSIWTVLQLVGIAAAAVQECFLLGAVRRQHRYVFLRYGRTVPKVDTKVH